MQIVNKIVIDLQQRKALPQVNAMQNDTGTRAVKVVLYDGGSAWTPPEGVTVSVAYRKADKTSGWYDKLPDGSDACSVSGNEATAVLAPQVLTAQGRVVAALVFQDASLNRLATFPFYIMVEADPAAGAAISNNYYKLQTLEDVNNEIEAIWQELETKTAEKTYELIEDFTTDQDATQITRNKDLNGVAYNFSKIKVVALFAAASAATQAVFWCKDANNSNTIYHTMSSGSISTSQRRAVFTAYNDGGLADYNAICNTTTTQQPFYAMSGYCAREWKNVAWFSITTYSNSGTVPIPAGTRILIYGIRG